MPKALPRLTLTENEHRYLQEYVSTGTRSARAIKRAHVLLQSAAGLPYRRSVRELGYRPPRFTTFAIAMRPKACGLHWKSGSVRDNCAN